MKIDQFEPRLPFVRKAIPAAVGLLALGSGCVSTPKRAPVRGPEIVVAAPAAHGSGQSPDKGARQNNTNPDVRVIDLDEPADAKPTIRLRVTVTQGGQLPLPRPVTFSSAGRLTPASNTRLGIIARYLRANPQITKFRIESHSDSQGSSASNQLQTQRQAMAVARWLVAKGIDCKRLVPVGFGETEPIVSNHTAKGRAQNRRTEFHAAARNGRPIGGLPIDGGGKVGGDPCHP